MKVSKQTALFSVLLGLVVTLSLMSSCSKKNSSSTSNAPTLYDSLGGTTMVSDPANPGTMIEQGRLGIRSVLDSTIFVIAGDTVINGFFQVLLAEVTAGNTSGYTALSNNFTDFVCVATGAKDFTYGGRNMTDAHNPGTNPRIKSYVTTAAFNEFIADVVVGAKQNNLPANLIASVGALLETLEGTVVQNSPVQ